MITRIFISAFLLTTAAAGANATVCGFGTTPERGSDGVLRCVAATANDQIRPSIANTSANSQNQSQAQTTQSTQSTQATGGDARITAPSGNAAVHLADKTETNTVVLPAPAMAAQLPAGFCTTGRSVQFSLLGVGYGSSASNFDEVNYKKCMAVALAMRSQTTQELVMAHCTQSDDVPKCVRDLMSAMQVTQTVAPVAQAVVQPVYVNVVPAIVVRDSAKPYRKTVAARPAFAPCAASTSICQPVKICEPIRLMGVLVNCKQEVSK